MIYPSDTKEESQELEQQIENSFVLLFRHLFLARVNNAMERVYDNLLFSWHYFSGWKEKEWRWDWCRWNKTNHESGLSLTLATRTWHGHRDLRCLSELDPQGLGQCLVHSSNKLRCGLSWLWPCLWMWQHVNDRKFIWPKVQTAKHILECHRAVNWELMNIFSDW